MTYAVVEYSCAATQDSFVALGWGISERNARRKIVVVAEDVLPVVSKARGYREIRTDCIVVLDECPKDFFKKCQMRVAPLQCEGIRALRFIIGKV